MAQRAHTLDLDSLHLPAGGGARLDLEAPLPAVELAGQSYRIRGGVVEARVDVSRTLSGFAFRMRFDAPLEGPCMRCLAAATPVVSVDAREVDQPGEAEELHSPYLEHGQLDVARWARDALVLALPPRLLCREDCKGLCPVCGESLSDADPAAHIHEQAGDSRWAKLSELKFE